MHSVAAFAAYEGVATRATRDGDDARAPRIRCGLVAAKDFWSAATLGVARVGGRDRASALCVIAQTSQNCRVQSSDCVSGRDECAARGDHARNVAKSWVDGCGVCSAPALHERKY